MRFAAIITTGSLFAGLLASAAQAATPTVTPAVVRAPGTVEARFTFVGLDEPSTVTIAPDAINLPSSAFGGEVATVKITGTRVEGGGTLTPDATIAAESGACLRGGVFPNDPKTYLLSVPAKATVTVVVSAQVPLGLPGREAGITLSHGNLQAPNGATTAEEIIETARIERTGSVDGLSLKASSRKAGKVTFTGRLIPARRGAKVTLVSEVVPDGKRMDVVGLGLFSEPTDAFDRRNDLKVLGSTRTTKGGRYRVTLKVPSNVGVAARTSGKRKGSSCGVLVEPGPMASQG